MYADTEDSMKGWIERINRAAQGPTSPASASGGSGSGGAATTGSTTTTRADPPVSGGGSSAAEEPKHDTKVATSDPTPDTRRADHTAPSTSGSPRAQISKAKEVIPFLQDEESKVLEFWQIWSESIPPRDELQVGLTIEYHVSTSANMQKLTWRTGTHCHPPTHSPTLERSPLD